jgi:endonuclease YncB( thermonuclease family)
MFPATSQGRTLQFVFVVAIPVLVLPSRTTVQAFDFTGPVVSVLDGDTIEVLRHQHPERIRFSGIDCLEKCQAYGTRRLYAE